MRPDSWRRGYPATDPAATMFLPAPHQEIDMTWQTPQAQDFRFGFEITMYVAVR
ncbi:MAG TPA: pyrroloquinoline quinone precursor peptide PqqA [Ramlibacter sp.]|uniref:pyrroloquinoline quinone precursor peptide PqqA n=1 Tax=Ramlibacter sp. TaxID=1917967 RepID=UPI002ED39DAD